MARNFSGGTDVVTLNLGATDFTGDKTIAAICYLTGDTTKGRTIFHVGTTGGSTHYLFFVETDSKLRLIDGSGASSPTAMTSNKWTFIAVNKASGTNNPRFHKYIYDSDTWLHENSSSTASDGTTPTGNAYIGNSPSGTPGWGGEIAAVGVWNDTLADNEIESLAHSFSAWWASSPAGLWVLDQSATTMKVNDWTGSGADESSLTGTAVSTLSVPIWTYGHSVEKVVYDTTTQKSVSPSVVTTVTLVPIRAKAILVTVATTLSKILRISKFMPILTTDTTNNTFVFKDITHRFTATTSSVASVIKNVLFTKKATQATTATLSSLRVILRTIAASVTTTTVSVNKTLKNLIVSAPSTVSRGSFLVNKLLIVPCVTLVTKGVGITRTLVVTTPTVPKLVKLIALIPKNITVVCGNTIKKMAGLPKLISSPTIVTMPSRFLTKSVIFTQVTSATVYKVLLRVILFVQSSTVTLKKVTMLIVRVLVTLIFANRVFLQVTKIIENVTVTVDDIIAVILKRMSVIIAPTTAILSKSTFKVLRPIATTSSSLRQLIIKAILISQITNPWLARTINKTLSAYQTSMAHFDKFRVKTFVIVSSTVTTMTWLYARWVSIGLKLIGFVYKPKGAKIDKHN